MKTYQAEEVQEILKIAISRYDRDGEITQAQLLEIAAELDLTPDHLQQAELIWRQQQLETQKRQEFDIYRQERFRHQTVRYLIIGGFVVVLDLLTGGGLSWSRLILLLLGTIIALHAWKTYQPKGEAYERALERWETKRQIKRTLSGIWQSVQRALQVG